MTKISRATQKQFGIDGNVSYFGQPGSINTTPTNTKDPATIQALSAFTNGIQDIVKSGTYKPALEDMNSLFLLAFQQIAYLFQAGVAEWDSGTTYYTDSIVNLSGTLYKSLTDTNLNNNPASSPSNWTAISGTPIGVSVEFNGPTGNIPNGFLPCDGSAVSRTTYANLFAAIGTTWGVGDGSTTFNLPNHGGIATIGYKSTDTDFNAVGKTGGEKTHLLTSAESGLKAHTHGWHTGTVGGAAGGALHGTTESQSLSTDANAASNASSAHNNLQPYAVVFKVIKY